MAILTDVKQALGIYYSETNKDAEITNIIAGAKAFLIGGGWPSADLADGQETALATQAVIIFAKMAVNTDPTEMQMNPVLVGMIAQARLSASAEDPVDPATPDDPTPEPEPEDPTEDNEDGE